MSGCYSKLRPSQDYKDTHADTHLYQCIYWRERTSCSHCSPIYSKDCDSSSVSLICSQTLWLLKLLLHVIIPLMNVFMRNQTLACVFVCIWTGVDLAESCYFELTCLITPQSLETPTFITYTKEVMLLVAFACTSFFL